MADLKGLNTLKKRGFGDFIMKEDKIYNEYIKQQISEIQAIQDDQAEVLEGIQDVMDKKKEHDER